MATAPVLCGACGAAYDLHDYPPGYRFRCGCGESVIRPADPSGEAAPEAPGNRPAPPAAAGDREGEAGADADPRGPDGRSGGTASGAGPGGCADPGPSPGAVRALVLACLFFVPGLPMVGAVLGWRAARAAADRGDETDRKVALAAVATGLAVTGMTGAALFVALGAAGA